jgi:hypothetical protein
MNEQPTAPEGSTVVTSATLTLPGPYIATIIRALRAGPYDLVDPILKEIERQIKAQHAPTNGGAAIVQAAA